MPDYEKYGFKNSVVDRLINRPVFNANTNEGGTNRNLEQEAKIKELSKTLNVPVEQTRTNLGENSAMTYLASAGAQGVKALIKYAAKNLAKKAAVKGVSKAAE
jgi:hypothetical protein